MNCMHISSEHPRYKHDIVYRFSRAGLAATYGQPVEFQGPIVQNVSYSNGSKTVNVTYTAAPSIELRNPNGFEFRSVRPLLPEILPLFFLPDLLSRKRMLEY